MTATKQMDYPLWIKLMIHLKDSKSIYATMSKVNYTYMTTHKTAMILQNLKLISFVKKGRCKVAVYSEKGLRVAKLLTEVERIMNEVKAEVKQ